MREAALDNRAWPESVVKVSNNLANQFESPVLFYALCLMLHAIDGVSLPALLLAWLYVALRVVHAGIHIGSNQLSRRMPVFVLGTGVLLALLGLSAWQLALAERRRVSVFRRHLPALQSVRHLELRQPETR